jgi:hypothetical protein
LFHATFFLLLLRVTGPAACCLMPRPGGGGHHQAHIDSLVTDLLPHHRGFFAPSTSLNDNCSNVVGRNKCPA